VLDNMV